ncbi:molybdenum cofactor biosynthesis protein [Photobacterium iliopiscarium]|uniref:molybdenum cofactor biosynthesis protein n=1 Tax=Photobacterium iliopiscarium TaxID=56192 RepID=UPI001E3C216A|nr:molybdenum cofactor biosynthesis protein [Photobacterium iliopiscarium]MCD9465932.1 molybdenum cofactor biosynthesis protein [Photobacterium iliopiscarium]MCD9487737.1 molybdenum cofactor biosynthesis protein [Photobacterium iliopiscarium]MCF2244361.1 molybdenum cofactor biosynthesis protein [Photobacterium iliopiscarium]
MDVKQSWGFISISLGFISLLWSVMSLNGMIGQDHLFAEMGAFLNLTGSNLYAENILAVERHKNFVVLLTGIGMASIGFLLIRGCYRK